MQAIDLLKKLLSKAGITYEGDLSADIPDDVATSLDNQLLTIAAATNNHPAVKKVYFAQAFNGLDAELNDLITEFGITDDVKAEIEKAGGSTKRAVALARKIKELSSKTQPADAGKAVELQAQINKLHGELQTEFKAKADLKSDYDKQLQKIKIDTKLSGILSGHKTVYDELPADAKEAAINSLLSKALQDSDADFTFDEKGNLSLIKKDGTNLFGDNHTLVTPQTFIDKTLSKILKVSAPAAQGSNINTTAATIPGLQQNSPNMALKAALAESADAYKSATTPIQV